MNRHQHILRELWEKTRDMYDTTALNLEYHNGDKDIAGEIDLLGYKEKDDRMDVYEVKSSTCECGIRKGLEQLEKSENYFKKHVRTLNKVLVLGAY